MSRLSRTWVLVASIAAVLGIGLSLSLGGAFGANAATGASASADAATSAGQPASALFNCRASVERTVLAGNTAAEPAVAGSSTACPTGQTLVQQTSLVGSGSQLSALNDLGTVGPAGAYTNASGAIGSGQSAGAAAVAQVNALSLNLAGYTLSAAGSLEAQATAYCAVGGSGGYATQPAVAGTSNLNALTLTSPTGAVQTIELGGTANQIVANLPAPLSALVSIKANEQILGPGSQTITERMLDITLLSSGVQIVVGEAVAGFDNPDVCSLNSPNTITNTVTIPTITTITGQDGTATTLTTPGSVSTITGQDGTATTVTTPSSETVINTSGTTPTFLEDCAPGSVLDSSSGNCVIYDGTQVIFVSKPFQGPSGGDVVSLTYAAAHFHSPCLSGAGPDWALIVAAVDGVAQGTPSSDRIIGLGAGEAITGLAGDDCIDAQGTHAKVTDGNGRDRVYVSSGPNRVIAGNGPNVIHGGHGRDWITDGTGNDTIYGGTLPNRIDAYGNEKHIYGGPGNDRIWTNSIRAFVNCGGGKANRLFARKKVAAYGAKHGCEKIGLLK
jgi:hypothetical protein